MLLNFFQKPKKESPRLDNATIAKRLAEFQMRQVESKSAWLATYEKAFGVSGVEAVRAHPRYQKLQASIARCLQTVIEGRDFHEEARRIADMHQSIQVPLADFLDACQAIGDEALKLGVDASFIARLRAFVREVVGLYEMAFHAVNRQLQARESTWQTIAQNVTEGIFVTTVEDGRILWANIAFARLLGYAPAELTGKRWMDLTPADLLKEELAGRFAKEQQENIVRYEKHFRHKDGHYVPILLSYQEIDGQAFDCDKVHLAVAVDISKQKAQEEALKRERSYWQDIVSSLSEGIVVFDHHHGAYDVNPAFAQMFGYSAEEVCAPGFNLTDKLIDPKDHPLIMEKIKEALATNRPVRFEVPHRHKDGRWVPVLLSFKKLIKKPEWETERLLATTIDLTEVKRHEKNLQAMLDYAKQLIERLAQGIVLEDESEVKGFSNALQEHYNRAISSLRHLLEGTQKTAAAITAAAEQLLHGQKALSQRVESEAASLEEIAASLEELSASIRETNDHVHSLAEFAQKMAMQADQGQASMQKMASDMSAMREQVNTIQEIIGVVEDIAFQTNLLSLNASVEAARAGQYGSGFAVIAEEIRRLANKTSGEAKTIRGWLKNLVRQTEESAKSAALNAKEVEIIATMAKEVNQHVGSISTAIADFTQAMRQIQETSGQLETHVQQNSAMAEEVSSAADHLKQEAERMNEVLGFFRMSNENAVVSFQSRENPPKLQEGQKKNASTWKSAVITPPKDDWEVF